VLEAAAGFRVYSILAALGPSASSRALAGSRRAVRPAINPPNMSESQKVIGIDGILEFSEYLEQLRVLVTDITSLKCRIPRAI